MQQAASASSSSCSRATHRRTGSNSDPFISASTRSPRPHTHSPRTRTSPHLENHLRLWRDSRVGQNGRSDSTGARTPIPLCGDDSPRHVAGGTHGIPRGAWGSLLRATHDHNRAAGGMQAPSAHASPQRRQLSDSNRSEASSPSESFALSPEELMAARSELTRQMDHKKAAHEALMKEMQQLQDRISMLETSAPTADRLLCSSPRRARPVATATTATETTATATMVTSTMVTATMCVRSLDVGDGSPDVDDDVARMPAGALPRCRSREKELARASSRTVSKVLTGLTDLVVTLAQARPKAGLHVEHDVDGHTTPSSVIDTASQPPCS